MRIGLKTGLRKIISERANEKKRKREVVGPRFFVNRRAIVSSSSHLDGYIMKQSTATEEKNLVKEKKKRKKGKQEK